MGLLGNFWKKLIGEEDFAFERRREIRRKALFKANKRKKPKSKHKKPKKIW
jgi:hypothetical protein